MKKDPGNKKENQEYDLLKDNTLNMIESILNSFDSAIYVTIPETGELVFVNTWMRKGFGIDDADLTGMYCYKIFRSGFEEKCDFCPCYRLDDDPDATIVWDEYLPEAQIHVRHSDCYINWYDGRKVHLQHAIDITDIMEAAERRIAEQYEYAKILTDALANVTKSPNISAGDLKAAADIIVKEGCLALGVTRVGVWSLKENGTALKNISCYDNLTGGYKVQNDFDLVDRESYIKRLKKERLIVTNDVKKLDFDLFYDGYSPGVCALLDAPVRIDGKLVGVVCVEQDYCNEYPEKRDWLSEEQNFASSLADLMSLAISGYERRIARDAAEKANRAKSAFLASMSHEIRTPMNAILGITDILIQNESLPEDIEEGLGRIYSSCDMLLSIINDLLDFSKIEAGKMDILPSQYKVASMINDTVQLNMMRIYSKPIEFKLQVDENTPEKLVGDELRIKQILSNLLSNAFKYTEEGTVYLSVVSEAESDDGGVTLVLTVKDTGKGMTKGQVKKLFQEEYLRFDEETAGTIEGTGLGLAITHGLVDMMNGSIKVKSKPDVGSTFTVRLPQKIVDKAILGKDVAANLEKFRMNYIARKRRGQIIRDMMPYGSVLVVDDMESNLYVATGLLRPYGLKIETAVSGQAAIDLINSGKKYDVIFMDHMMPEMDGIEATKKIRALGYDKPIVALTANAVSGQASVFLQTGFDEFISKPVDTRRLNSVLNKLVRDRHPSGGDEATGLQQEPKNDKTQEVQEKQGILSKSITGLDIARGIEQHDGNVKYYLKVLRSYAAGVRSVLSEIENVTRDMLPEYKMKVHGIKGASSSIFAGKIGDLAGDLEQAAANNDFDFVEKQNRAFIDDIWKFIIDIDALLAELDTNDNKTLKDKPDDVLLSELLNACREYNMDDVEKIMEKIDEYRYESDDGLASWLSDKVNLMGYTQIVERLTSIINQ